MSSIFLCTGNESKYTSRCVDLTIVGIVTALCLPLRLTGNFTIYSNPVMHALLPEKKKRYKHLNIMRACVYDEITQSQNPILICKDYLAIACTQPIVNASLNIQYLNSFLSL